MPDETETKVMTKDELIQAIGEAYNKGEYKLMGKLSGQMAKFEADEAKAAKDAQLAVVVGLTEKVKKVIDKAVAQMISDGQLDVADGIWYSQDFGDKLTSCRLLKGTVRKASSGTGGGGKKFSDTPAELLAQCGGVAMFSEAKELKVDGVPTAIPAGMTYQEAYDLSTDGNWRYKVRVAMLKHLGKV